MASLRRCISIITGVLLCAVGVRPRALAQGEEIRIRGAKLDSKEMVDSLSLPYWRAIAATPCPAVSWKPSYANDAAFQASRAPLLSRLRRASGQLLPPTHGEVFARRTVFENSRYKIQRMWIASRLTNVSITGFLATPLGVSASAPVLLLHGSGMVPAEAFGWSLRDQYGASTRFENTVFTNAAVELVEAGYTVFVPWFGDEIDNDSWPYVQWRTLGRNSSILGAKTNGLNAYYLLLNEVAAVIDFLALQPAVNIAKLSAVGWAEGAQIASLAAAEDARIQAVVRLAAPLDRRAFRRTVDGVFAEASFTHMDCALGDAEMAALVAPRPLLFAYSTRDQSVARSSAFIAPGVAQQIKSMYEALRRPRSFAVFSDSSWTGQDARRVRTWLDGAVGFAPRSLADSLVSPRTPVGEPYRSQYMTATESGRRQYIASLGPCIPPAIVPSLASVDAFSSSVEPLRTLLATRLHAARVTGAVGFRVVRRVAVLLRGKYTLEYVELQSGRSSIPVTGFLATPITGSPDARLPAVISADANYGLAGPFGLLGGEKKEYLNAYADYLASHGTVVFAPWMPAQFTEVAPNALRARNPSGATSFTFTMALFAASVDFVASLPAVDPERIGTWGISYAGFNALYLAALDKRISAILYSNPVTTAEVLFSNDDASVLAPFFGEICSMIDPTLEYLIAPRRLIRENGLHDDNGYERSPLESVVRIREVYDQLGIPGQFDFYRHSGGHLTLPRTIF
ncbi:hypothetical protein BH09GEM1_BH09GEM1_35710 [soil metagenome]